MYECVLFVGYLPEIAQGEHRGVGIASIMNGDRHLSQGTVRSGEGVRNISLCERLSVGVRGVGRRGGRGGGGRGGGRGGGGGASVAE